MTTVQTTAQHLTSDEAYAEVASGEPIGDAAAATIASWWQSPGTIGRHLATLASGLPVDAVALVDDITATYREANETASLPQRDADALEALTQWVMFRADGD